MAYDARLWALAQKQADAVAWGSLDWVGVNGDWRARVPVAALNFGPNDVVLEMVVRPGMRSHEPSVVLMANGVAVRRVDVNQVHREDGVPKLGSHVQGEPPPGSFDWLSESHFPELAQGESVPGEDYYRVFTASAAIMGVNVQGVEWSDPPEGRP